MDWATFSDDHQRELAAILAFLPDDLNANRQGKLSAYQVETQRGVIRRRYWPSLTFWSLVGAAVGTLYLIGNVPIKEAAGFFLVGAIIAFLSARALRHELQYLVANQEPVTCEDFCLGVDVAGHRQRFPATLTINERKFTLPGALVQVLKPNKRYRLYYIYHGRRKPFVAQTVYEMYVRRLPSAKSHAILSIEPLSLRCPKMTPRRK